MEVEVLFDVPRIEEKLILKALRERGIEVKLSNVKEKPLSWTGEASIALIRPISMMRAVYSAAIREASGVLTINKSSAIMLAGDKILTLSKFKEKGLPFPETVIAFTPQAAEKAGELIGFPAVDKPPIGSWGRLVTLLNDPQVLRSVIEHREILPSQSIKTHVIQRYIESSKRDIRVIVLGGEALGAMCRIAENGDWRSNVALGGRVEAYRLDEELEELAVKAAEAVEGEFVAVDLLSDNGGYLVNEVNGVPEFKGFIKATKINVAGKLADYVKSVYRR